MMREGEVAVAGSTTLEPVVCNELWQGERVRWAGGNKGVGGWKRKKENLRNAGYFPNQVREGWLAALWIMQSDLGEQGGYDPE